MKPKRSSSIRNVSIQTSQTTSPFAYANDNKNGSNLDLTGRPTDIASQFNADYETKGLQPSVGTRPTPGKPNKVTATYNQRGVRTAPATNNNDEQWSFQNESQNNKISRRKESLETGVDSAKIAGLRKVVKLKKIVKGHATATRISITIVSTAGPLWLSIQLPLALLAIFALGMSALSDAAAEAVLGTTVGAFLNTVLGIVSGAIGYVTGTDPLQTIQGLNETLFLTFTALTFFFGAMTLLAMGVVYSISSIRCFFGDHAGLKMATFILALLGYLMPILNLLPWFVLWGIVVWRYPK